MKTRRPPPPRASDPFTGPPVRKAQRRRPVRASIARTAPVQSPTKTSPSATSGEDAAGERRRRPRAAARAVAPDRLSGGGVERVEAAVEGREVEAAAGDRGRE